MKSQKQLAVIETDPAWKQRVTDVFFGASLIRDGGDATRKEAVVRAARELHDYLRANAGRVIEVKSNEMGAEGLRKRLQELKETLDAI